MPKAVLAINIFLFLHSTVHEKFDVLTEKYETLMNGLEKTDKATGGVGNGGGVEVNSIDNPDFCGTKGNKKQCELDQSIDRCFNLFELVGTLPFL